MELEADFAIPEKAVRLTSAPPPLVGEQIDSANSIPQCIAAPCPLLSADMTSDHAQFVAQPYLPHRMDKVCKVVWRFGESQV